MKKVIALSSLLLCLPHISIAQSDNSGTGQAAAAGSAATDAQNQAGDEVRMRDEFRDLGKLIDNAAYMTKKSARPAFVSVFKQAQNAVMADDLKKTEANIQKLAAMPHLNNYEQARLHLINYWYYGKLGNKEMENESASKLLALGAGNVDADAFVEAGIRLLKRQYNAQDIGGAINTLNNLRKETSSIIELNSIASAVSKLDEISAQTTDISLKIRVNEKGSWNTKLLKPYFFFNSINGEISKIDFICDNKQTTVEYKADSVMVTPEAWGSCNIKLTTTPNTSFNFVQMQNKPS